MPAIRAPTALRSHIAIALLCLPGIFLIAITALDKCFILNIIAAAALILTMIFIHAKYNFSHRATEKAYYLRVLAYVFHRAISRKDVNPHIKFKLNELIPETNNKLF
ncbi:TPA: hypothetical protein NIU34_000573 [Klebsiella oxytoca]|uniref:Uncharacterized protein n=1 Tax=Klebsiella oxytoca TaxID=571 RepID=A0AAD3UIA0_KLEOX|nr:hypothetical protein [Klebsiella oxytoca]AKL04142.1 hypothetical protein AB184_02355 [Klebsiella oxytoca]AKL21063.1 hypothetical protein AB181_02605 [Klebsiella oxytoca]APB44050.1 hypothetical protein AGF18_08985 [Klebsiella oxytoca]EJB5612890.1 hypothetical protein [Klebsiella oxytoca]EJY1759843.1 hypothetical protein [Klebsiella oxytoca]